MHRFIGMRPGPVLRDANQIRIFFILRWVVVREERGCLIIKLAKIKIA